MKKEWRCIISGNSEGAKKAVKTKLERYGSKIFSENGRKGGRARNVSKKRYSPFSDPEFASKMGKIGSKKRWSNQG